MVLHQYLHQYFISSTPIIANESHFQMAIVQRMNGVTESHEVFAKCLYVLIND